MIHLAVSLTKMINEKCARSPYLIQDFDPFLVSISQFVGQFPANFRVGRFLHLPNYDRRALSKIEVPLQRLVKFVSELIVCHSVRPPVVLTRWRKGYCGLRLLQDEQYESSVSEPNARDQAGGASKSTPSLLLRLSRERPRRTFRRMLQRLQPLRP